MEEEVIEVVNEPVPEIGNQTEVEKLSNERERNEESTNEVLKQKEAENQNPTRDDIEFISQIKDSNKLKEAKKSRKVGKGLSTAILTKITKHSRVPSRLRQKG